MTILGFSFFNGRVPTILSMCISTYCDVLSLLSLFISNPFVFFCFLFYFVVSLSLYVFQLLGCVTSCLGDCVPHVLHLWLITPAFPLPLYNPLCSPLVASVRTRFNTVSLMVCLVPAVLSASAHGPSVFPVRPVPAWTLRLSPV